MRADFDSGYKQLFAHPEMVRDLLQAFLPYTWAAQLDVAAFERINASYVGGAGATGRASDTGGNDHEGQGIRFLGRVHHR
jgi:hypothetical protein